MEFHDTNYDHGMVMHVKFLEDVVYWDVVYCPIIALISINLSIQSHKLVTYHEWNFLKLILNIYDHNVVP